MKQYLDIMKDILDNGVMVQNERTGVKCLTVLNKQLTYTPDVFPLLTTRKSFWKQAICEILCYIRGYTNLDDFHKLGVNTWDANASAESWKNNPNYKENDVGLIYGASAEKVGRGFLKIIEEIKNKPSDRGIIWDFWNPEYFNQGCLRPCMYNHQFNVLNGVLYLSSTQRSIDTPLGLNFNMIQCWFLLMVVAKLTGLKPGHVIHNLVNVHIYENQIELAKEQVKRTPYKQPDFIFKKEFTLDDIMKNITKENFDEYFAVENYEYHPVIKYPFTV